MFLQKWLRAVIKWIHGLIHKENNVTYRPGKEWSNDFLEKKRQLVDPEADRVIKHILDNAERTHVNDLFTYLTRDAGSDFSAFHPVVQEYFRTTSQFPSWVDKERLKKGQEVFMAFGAEMTLILFCKSMPSSYACADGSKILYDTGRLNIEKGEMEPYNHRLAQTSQFVINVMKKGGLEPDSDGIITAQKIRLIHAAIRYQLNERGWDSKSLGAPINQEDMAGTLMAFCVLVLEGLRQLKANLTEQQESDYYYCWRAIGHIMGVDKDLIPDNVSDALSLGHAILDRNKKKSEWGAQLTQSCIEFLEKMVPGGLFKNLGAGMVLFMLGDDLAQYVDVKVPDNFSEEHLSKELKTIMGGMTHLEEDMPFLQKIFGAGNRLLLQGMTTYINDRQKVRFEIPENMLAHWNIKSAKNSSETL